MMGNKKSKIYIALVILVIILINIFYIWQDNKIEEEYYCSTSEAIPEISDTYPITTISQSFITDNSSLNSLEFLFGNVPTDVSSLTLKIMNDTKVIYQSTIPLQILRNDTWYRLYVNIPVKSQKKYSLELTADNSPVPSVYIVSKDNSAPENQTLMINGIEQSGQLLVRYGYLREPLNMDKLLETFTSLFVLILIIYFIFKYDLYVIYIKKYLADVRKKMGNNQKLIFILFELLNCYLLIGVSGIEFQIPVMALMYIISLLVGYKIQTIIEYYKNILNSRSALIQYLIVLFFSAFTFVGNRMFIYPLNMKVTVIQIFVFILAIIWMAPLILLFLSWYSNIKLVEEEQCGTLKFCAIAIAFLIIPACYALYAFNPGISSPDTENCLVAAHHIRNMVYWHPPFYCMLLKLIIMIWDSTYAVIIVQIFFWTYVVLEGMLFVRKRGISQSFLLIFAFLLGINPANYIHLCTIWKDVPYAISLMWLIIIFARLVLDKNSKNRWYIYLELVVALVFIFFIRRNGIVVYALSIAFCSAFLRKNTKLIISILISIGLIVFIKYPLYSYLGIQESNGGIYIGLGQDILGVYYAGGNLSEESMEMVNVLTFHNNGQFNYDPYRADSSYDLDVSITTFIKNYLDTFFKNPVTMTREILCRQDCVWDLFGGQNATLHCVNYAGTQDYQGEWNNYYPVRINNEYTYSLSKYQNYTVSNQLLNILTWKTGIYTLLVVFAFLSVLIKKKDRKIWLVFVPFAGQIVSLMLSTGWSDFRYYWPLNLIAVFILLLIPTVKEVKKEVADEIINI